MDEPAPDAGTTLHIRVGQGDRLRERLRAAERGEDPASIRQVAQLVDRGYREVHMALTELASLNVIEFEREGSAKRPVVRFDDIEIEGDIADG